MLRPSSAKQRLNEGLAQKLETSVSNEVVFEANY